MSGGHAAVRAHRAEGSLSQLADATELVMHGEEAARAASFGRVVAILCAAGLALVTFDRTPLFQRGAMAIAQAVLGSVGAWVWWRSRDPRRYSRGVFRFFAVTAALAAVVFIQYFGVFSPAVAVVVLGLAFFGQADDERWIFGISGFIVVAYALQAVLVATELVPDFGLYVPFAVPTTQRLTMALMVSAVLVMQLVQARLSRRATREALHRANDAARIALTQEAQLEEARDNLDAALKAGAGPGGRFSGTRVGRYRLAEVVGRGGMGEVYAAEIAGSGGRAAVKLLHATRMVDPEIVRRFVREAEIATRVRGRNLVEVYEVGSTPDGIGFIAMELLSGTDLATLLRDRGALSVPEVLTLVDDIAHGLEALHQAGVVHRDLKPQNLFLAMSASGPPQPRWKILDYGVSKVIDGSATVTMGQLVGTPGYMSPEQAENREVDARSDVFALGAVAYRALTGRRAFSGRETAQILYQVVFGAPVRPREIAPHLPADLELVLGMALAKRPESRFASATLFANALRDASSGVLDVSIRRAAAAVVRAQPFRRESKDLPRSPGAAT